MREILFRGKRLDNGEWIEGDLLRGKLKQQLGKSYIDPLEIQIDNNGYLLPIVEVRPETIGQYTGLTDKNGKKIFEGDILYSAVDLDGDGVLCEEYLMVYFDEKLAGFLLKSNLSELPCEIEDCGEMKIVGNIHSNPELLEVME